MAQGARAEAGGEVEGDVRCGGAGHGLDPRRARPAQGENGPEPIDRAQKIRIEGGAQERQPGAARPDADEGVAVEGVDRRVREGGGDGFGRTVDEGVAGAGEENERRARGGDPHGAVGHGLDPLDSVSCEARVRLGRRHRAGPPEAMMRAGQRGQGRGGPHPAAGQSGDQDRHQADGCPAAPTRRLKRLGAGSAAKRRASGSGAPVIRDPRRRS